jgi:tight adherence protein C
VSALDGLGWVPPRGLLGSCLLLAWGAYLLVTCLPAFRAQPSLREQLMWTDVDERARLESVRVDPPMFASRFLERTLRPVLEDLGTLLHAVRERLGIGGAEELKRNLELAGRETTVGQWYGKKIGAALIMVSPWLANLFGLSAGPLWLWLAAGLFGFVWYDRQLRDEIARRRLEILYELEPLLDLISIATEGTRGVEQALMEVAEKGNGPVARQLSEAVGEMRFGTPLTVALDRMAQRNGVPELALFVREINSAIRMGGADPAQALRRQTEALRERRRVLLVRQGKLAEVKMIVPVALFILPVFIAVILLPALVDVLELGR